MIVMEFREISDINAFFFELTSLMEPMELLNPKLVIVTIVIKMAIPASSGSFPE